MKSRATITASLIGAAAAGIELIERLHEEHLERQAALLGKLHEVQEHVANKPAAASGPTIQRDT